MRLGGYVTVMLLLATLSDCHNDTHAHIGIDCCSLMDSMQRFIALETNPVMHCHPETCMASSLVKLFVQETDTQMELQRQPTSIVLTIPAEDNRFTEMLVWALIGRHYAANLAGDHTHFIFNTATQTLTAKMPKCEFQKPIYTILLFVSIILLIFSLVLQNLKKKEQQPPGLTAALPSSATNMSTHMSFDFTPRRRLMNTSHYMSVPSC